MTLQVRGDGSFLRTQSPEMNYGCCDFQIKAKDEVIICGRSMEFPIPLASKLVFHNREEKRASFAPDGPTDDKELDLEDKRFDLASQKNIGLEWVSKYGYTAVNALGMDAPVEGMNEEGLSFGFLSLDCSEYQTVDVKNPEQRKQALALMDVGSWILGNFKNVEEVKAAIGSVRIWGNRVAQLNEVPRLHIALHDANGKNLVIEFINGVPEIKDNPIGVLTNDPPLDWHLIDLRRYNGLSPNPAPGITINGEEIPSPGIGTEMIGFPGDLSSVSRFIRVAIMVDRVMAKRAMPATAMQGVNTAFHILNTVDIPTGFMIVPFENNTVYETTRWNVVKNLSERILFYRSYTDLNLRGVNLKEIDFAPGTLHEPISIQGSTQSFIDMTPQTRPENSFVVINSKQQ